MESKPRRSKENPKQKVINTFQGLPEVDTLSESVWEGDMWEIVHFPHDRSPPKWSKDRYTCIFTKKQEIIKSGTVIFSYFIILTLNLHFFDLKTS